jgi:outer membrane lipopolysaccharide assembly protein LptE/RlpB
VLDAESYRYTYAATACGFHLRKSQRISDECGEYEYGVYMEA